MDILDRDALYLSGISGIWRRIRAYMLWPADDRLRQAWVLSSYPKALASIERHSDTERDYARALDICYGNFRELGGWTALEPLWSSNLDLKKNESSLRIAAAVLDIIRKNPSREGSLNKAVHVIDKTGMEYGLVSGRNSVLGAWKSHRAVAHLEIARILFRACPRYLECPRCLRRFLLIARDYQQFATTYIVPRQKAVLIEPAEIWSVPDGLSFRATQPPPLGRLPEDMLKALGTYQSPH